MSKLKEQLVKDARRKGLDLTVSVLNQLPTIVKGEPDRLKDLIIYFTNNAFKQSPSVRVVINLVGTKEDISMLRLSFEDDGHGMSEEQLDVCSLSVISKSLTKSLGYLPRIRRSTG